MTSSPPSTCTSTRRSARTGRRVYRNVKSIEKTGDMEVTVKLTQPDSMWNQYMAVSPGTIESAAFLRAGRRGLRQPEHGRQLHRPVPVRQAGRSGQSITLKRYDDYWDADLKAKSGEVKFVFQQDPNTRVNAWQDGEVDGGWFGPVQRLRAAEDQRSGRALLRPQHHRGQPDRLQPQGPARRPGRPQGAADGDRPRGHHQGRRSGSRRDLERAGLEEHLGRPVRPTRSTRSTTSCRTYDYDVEAAKQLVADKPVSTVRRS